MEWDLVALKLFGGHHAPGSNPSGELSETKTKC